MATAHNDPDDKKRIARNRQRQAETLAALTAELADKLDEFADDAAAGSAEPDDYYAVVREIAELFSALEDAAENGAGVEATEPTPYAICEAFRAIHHLSTVASSDGDAIRMWDPHEAAGEALTDALDHHGEIEP